MLGGGGGHHVSLLHFVSGWFLLAGVYPCFCNLIIVAFYAGVRGLAKESKECNNGYMS